MKITNYIRSATYTTALLLSTVYAGGDGWLTDFEAAKKQAADEKKSMLIDFTGSDWCGWCVKLNKEVFVHDAFKNGVKDTLVLVELDFPKDKSKVTEEIAKQNKELQEKYSVKGFPTILITDELGRPYAKTGYQAGGPEAYVTSLNQLLALRAKRDASFAEADKATGVAKAQALITALKDLQIDEELVASFYSDKIDAIKTADPKDESGYLKGMENKKKFVDFQNKLNQSASKKDFDGVMKVIDESLAANEFEGELKQQTMIFKAITFMQLKKPEDALKTLDEAKAVAPESPISAQIDGLKKRIEASVPK